MEENTNMTDDSKEDSVYETIDRRTPMGELKKEAVKQINRDVIAMSVVIHTAEEKDGNGNVKGYDSFRLNTVDEKLETHEDEVVVLDNLLAGVVSNALSISSWITDSDAESTEGDDGVRGEKITLQEAIDMVKEE